MNYLSKNLLFLRKRNKWNQHEMPVHTTISRTAWSNYENGRSQPTIDKLIHIAKIFGVLIDPLLNTDMSANAVTNPHISNTNNIGETVLHNATADANTVREQDIPLEKTKGQVNLILDLLHKVAEDVKDIKATLPKQ